MDAGALDLALAIPYFSVTVRAPLTAVPQNVASGLLGARAYSLGNAGVVLGIGLHYCRDQGCGHSVFNCLLRRRACRLPWEFGARAARVWACGRVAPLRRKRVTDRERVRVGYSGFAAHDPRLLR